MKKTNCVHRKVLNSERMYAILFTGIISSLLCIIGYLVYYLVTHEREIPSGNVF